MKTVGAAHEWLQLSAALPVFAETGVDLKKNKKPLQSQHDITAGPIVCRFTHPPISLPALPFTHWALYHSHTWKSVTSSPNTTSLLFPLALWRQQGSPLLALIYNAVKLIQTCVFMRALISIVCACVYSREENCQSKMKPWLHFNPEAPASSEQHRSGEIQSVSISRNAVQRQNTTNFTGKPKRASPHLMSHSFCVAMAAWRWAIITVHPQRAGHDGEIWAVSAAPESMTPERKHQVGAEDGAPPTARKLQLDSLQRERALCAFI